MTAIGESVLVIGAGQAGVTAATTLRDSGFTGGVVLVGDEHGAPYQRPPLSKTYLAGTANDNDLMSRAPETFARDGIDYRPGRRVVTIDRDALTATLDDGATLSYSALVLATGSRARTLPIPGGDLDGVLTLRTRVDSINLKQGISRAQRVVVIGGGFLGLEVAATAAQAGCAVRVLERFPRLLARSVGANIAAHLDSVHRDHNVEIDYNATVQAIEQSEAGLLVTSDHGAPLAADLVLVAVGAEPATELAADAGLDIDGGIVVDEQLRTGDQRIFAIGDCARYPSVAARGVVRLESVQNATDQARFVAAQLIEPSDRRYSSVPWFWSHQYDRNLQIAGVASPDAAEIVLVGNKPGSLTVARTEGELLVAVESVNDPKAHMKARRLFVDGPVHVSRLPEIGQPA